MTNELKPCPFCGGGTHYYAPAPIDHHIQCEKCFAETGGFFSKEAAIEAWNTRAERTCEIARVETGEPAEYDCDEVLWHCESCHEEVAIYAYNENGDTWADKPAFCPNCGAKVVE